MITPMIMNNCIRIPTMLKIRPAIAVPLPPSPVHAISSIAFLYNTIPKTARAIPQSGKTNEKISKNKPKNGSGIESKPTIKVATALPLVTELLSGGVLSTIFILLNKILGHL